MSYESRARGKYHIIDMKSGEHLDTYFNDEGYKVMDVDTLKRVLPQLQTKGIRIAKIDWKNYDEVEIYIQVDDTEDKDEIKGSGQKAKPLDRKGIRYVIFNQRNGDRLGTFITDEANSILDKMVLYQMFPQFDLKSLRITSLNWTEEGEVRVYIRGKLTELDRKKPV